MVDVTLVGRLRHDTGVERRRVGHLLAALAYHDPFFIDLPHGFHRDKEVRLSQPQEPARANVQKAYLALFGVGVETVHGA